MQQRIKPRLRMETDLRRVHEIPNTPFLNACPIYTKKEEGKREKLTPQTCVSPEIQTFIKAPVTRSSLFLFIVLAATIWCSIVQAFLHQHRFPYHRHKVTAALVYTLPSLTFACVMTSIDAQLTLRHHSD